MMDYGARIRLVSWSGLVGWLAGFLASVPAQVMVGYRDSEGAPRLFVETVAMGLVVWALWTLLLGAAAWVVFALPCALLVSPSFLVKFRLRVLALTAVMAVVFVLLKLYPYQDYAASRVMMRFVLFMPYGAFAIFFAVMTAWWYLRGLGRGLGRERGLLNA